MEDAKGALFVPDILALPLERLPSGKFVEKVVRGNYSAGLELKRLRSLYGSIIMQCYYFEEFSKRERFIFSVGPTSIVRDLVNGY